jgi:hypothetical protein
MPFSSVRWSETQPSSVTRSSPIEASPNLRRVTPMPHSAVQLCYNITIHAGFVDRDFVTGPHPLLISVMARSALLRLAALLGILGGLWLAILWAVSLP